jgi:hypothetical protein
MRKRVEKGKGKEDVLAKSTCGASCRFCYISCWIHRDVESILVMLEPFSTRPLPDKKYIRLQQSEY